VARCKPGPHPGEKGSAVISGRSGYANGVAAVFDDLPDLRRGDLLFVEDARGVRIAFVVRSSRDCGRDADASDVFGRTDGRHLDLVTCTWRLGRGRGHTCAAPCRLQRRSAAGRSSAVV